MPDISSQTRANHKRLVPGYHFVAAALLLLNLGYAGWTLVRSPSFPSVVSLTTAIALLLIGFYARAFALTIQDRVIRLEERLRLQRLLPPEIQSRIEELTVGQLVGLRFASDNELGALAERVLSENLTDRTAIKELIVDWKPDTCRV